MAVNVQRYTGVILIAISLILFFHPVTYNGLTLGSNNGPLSASFTTSGFQVTGATPNGQLNFVYLSGSSFGTNLQGVAFTGQADGSGNYFFSFPSGYFSAGTVLQVTDSTTDTQVQATYGGEVVTATAPIVTTTSTSYQSTTDYHSNILDTANPYAIIQPSPCKAVVGVSPFVQTNVALTTNEGFTIQGEVYQYEIVNNVCVAVSSTTLNSPMGVSWTISAISAQPNAGDALLSAGVFQFSSEITSPGVYTLTMIPDSETCTPSALVQCIGQTLTLTVTAVVSSSTAPIVTSSVQGTTQYTTITSTSLYTQGSQVSTTITTITSAQNTFSGLGIFSNFSQIFPIMLAAAGVALALRPKGRR